MSLNIKKWARQEGKDGLWSQFGHKATITIAYTLLNVKLIRCFDNWRTRSQPIRTFSEITAHIKIFPVHQPYLYQKLSKKATQLRLLGMSYQQIAKSLNINKRTAMKACRLDST